MVMYTYKKLHLNTLRAKTFKCHIDLNDFENYKLYLYKEVFQG